MTTFIEAYLNSLSEDILVLNISRCWGIKYLPDLTRFNNLETLYCYSNFVARFTAKSRRITLQC